jgi:N-acetylmuramoyl-L-alanine amidase
MKVRLLLFSFFFYLKLLNLHASQPIVILDPGHGGTDTGAKVNTDKEEILEKNLTLKIALKLKSKLENYKITTFLTRTSDEVVKLDERIRRAKKFTKNQNAIFISLHLNSSHDSNIHGIETYVFNGATNEAAQRLYEIENGSFRIDPKGMVNLILSDLTATANYADSVKLACHLHLRLTQSRALDFPNDRYVRPGLFYILMNSPWPSVLLELGYITNIKDRDQILNEKSLDLLTTNLSFSIKTLVKNNFLKHNKTYYLSGLKKTKRPDLCN